jgi:uncharacterized membrane protein
MKEDEVKAIQEELDRLNEQLQLQQQAILQLRKQLAQHAGIEHKHPAPPSRAKQHTPFSLENFIGLRLIHFVGIIVLVIGLSIGVKYAIDRNLISEGLRIGLAYAAGGLLFFLSMRLKKNYSLFSAILFSGGMASLYFTTYAAYVYYSMLSFPLAFLIMIALTVYTVFEAIRYNREEIAMLGLVGAYGIPFLISKNADRPELFFLYITMINSGVVYLCIRQTWKTVGRLAQGITWFLFIAWAARPFTEKPVLTGFIFMSLFFLLFLFMILLFRQRKKMPFTENDAYQLILNNVALYIAALFVFGYTQDSDLASITLGLAALTTLQALLFHYFLKEERMVTRMLASLALALFVLFIAFNWTGFVVTLLWLLTAVIVFAWGFLMRSVPARMMGMVLMGVTLGKLLAFDSLNFSTVQKVMAYLILGVLLLVVSFFYQKFRDTLFKEED